MAEIKFSRFVELKSKVKAEMLRRNGTGSVSAYGNTDYDYTDISGQLIRKEHYEKNIVPLRKVSTVSLPDESGERPVLEAEIIQMEAKATTLAAISKTSSAHGCDAACTGLCYTACNTSCQGCDGCSGCGGACSYGCTGCDNTCRGDCDGTCKGCTSCTSTCGSDTCTAACSGCTAACWPGCNGACHKDKSTTKGGEGTWFLQVTKQKLQ